MGPQPLGLSGPMTQGRLMTGGNSRRRLQTLSCSEDEQVPSCYGSLANHMTKVLRCGSIVFGKNPTCQHTTNICQNLLQSRLCPADSYSKQEPNVRTLWSDLKTMVHILKLNSPLCNVKTVITVRQSKSLEDQEIGKQFASLWREFVNTTSQMTYFFGAKRVKNNHR